ncbi:MAG: PTS glucitol/sorbitol transporter subunit IIB [Lachnospiraceae bacterium]|nr:PTS glucitol/sorbitol transporter subunit IIB [Lachnospiraceae bacterium]
MSEYRAIRVEKGSGGFGGPLTIQGTEKKNKVMYITGGGVAPEILPKIVELTGLEPVNGFKTSAPEDELALVIIDCGGTLRCGLYPKKRIPTININPVGKAGPLAQFIKEDIYVSGVTNANISLADPAEAAAAADAAATETAADASAEAEEKKGGIDTSKKLSEQMAESGNGNMLAKIGLGAGKVVATFNQAARDAVQTAINTLLPFMAFVSMLIGIINGTGFGTFFSGILQPLLGSIPGLLVLGIICSIPGLSAILGPGAVISQILGGIMGAEIAAGRISPSLALVGLFALNCHAACDFIPVGLGLAEAETETVEVGVMSVMYSRFITSWVRVLLAVVFSIGMYAA